MAVDPNIKKKANDIRNKIYGKEVRESLASGLEEMSSDVVETVGRQGNVEEQFQDVIDNTTDKDVISAPEIIAARNGESNLKARLDKENQELTSQLAQNTKNLNDSLATYSGKPIVSFTSDDANVADINRFKPIFDAEGVPCNICVITNSRESNYLNWDQLRGLKREGWVVASHTHTHPRLRDITDWELDYEFKTSQDILKEQGLDYDILVYPYGSVDDRVERIARRYYRYAIDIDRNTPAYPPYINNMKISRASGLSQERLTMEEIKQLVDDSLETGNWLIFEDHSHYAYYANQENLDKLQELIQYVKSKGIEIVNLREGFARKANIIDTNSLDGYTRIARNGELLGSSAAYEFIDGSNGVTNDTPIYDYPVGKVIESRISTGEASAGGLPEGLGGVKTTHRHTSDYYSYEIYNISSKDDIYMRWWNEGQKRWDSWRPVTYNPNLHLTQTENNQFDVNTPLTDFGMGITVTVVSDNVTIENGYPLDAYSGYLETHRYGSSASRQEFRSGKSRYVRRWLSSQNDWDVFEEF